MKNTLLITASVLALVAGIDLASAQGLNERKEAPPAAASEQKAPEGETGHQKSALPQKSEKMKPGTSAQVPEKTTPPSAAQAPEKAKPVPSAEVQEKAKPIPTAQATDKKTDSDHQTVGQSPSQKTEPNVTEQRGSEQKGSKSFAAAPTAEQNVKIRDSLKGEKAERLNNVQFSISIGDAVPRTVHFYRLPARIVEYAPQYRDFDYILVGDDILIVDPSTHLIVAVIPA